MRNFLTCGWCEGYGCDTETRVICRHCHRTGDEPEDQAVLLITEDKKRNGTQAVFTGTAVFVRLNDNGQDLHETEKLVLEMIRLDYDTWKCGCVTGIPKTVFTEWERGLFNRYGIYNRFEL